MVRRVSFWYLSAFPFIALVFVAIRDLRIPGVYHAIGALQAVVIGIAAWTLGARAIAFDASGRRKLALAGGLLVFPWAAIALLWVGLGAPFQATAAENHMRFLVLLTNAIVIAAAFVVLKEELHEAGERFYSAIGLAAGVTAGVAYLVCLSMSAAASIAEVAGKDASIAGGPSEMYDVLEFVACNLTYVATAAFATSLRDLGWLGRNAARAYQFVCLVMVTLLLARGLSYPDLSADTDPWYMRPALIAGIPAIPWLMPCLLGVVVLRRAGEGNAAQLGR